MINKITIIVPAYNEEKGIDLVLKAIAKVINNDYEILVVDDGSNDNTYQVALKYPCNIVRHKVNIGKGEAIKTGVLNAKGDYLLFIDADDSYPVDVIPLMALGLNNYKMVIGSRLYGKNNIPAFNRFGNFIFRTMIRGIYGFTPHDPLTGLWGIRKVDIQKILPTMRAAPDAEIAIKAAKSKLPMLDVPITYRPRVGRTKLNPIKAGFEHVYLILSLLFWKPGP